MNIKSVTFTSNDGTKSYELRRLYLVHSNVLSLQQLGSTEDSTTFTVTNEAVAANLIRAKVTNNKNGYQPDESLVDYKNMVAFLTQG